MILNDFKGMPLLPPTKEKVNAIARDVCHLSVCLSVCLLARLFKNACMD